MQVPTISALIFMTRSNHGYSQQGGDVMRSHSTRSSSCQMQHEGYLTERLYVTPTIEAMLISVPQEGKPVVNAKLLCQKKAPKAQTIHPSIHLLMHTRVRTYLFTWYPPSACSSPSPSRRAPSCLPTPRAPCPSRPIRGSPYG